MCGEHIDELYTVYLTKFRNFFTTPKEGRGPQTDEHLPPSTFTGQFLRKPDMYGLVSL